jgi:hypothetical protein
MSAAELVKRFGIDGMTAEWIEYDVQSAVGMVRVAANWASKASDFSREDNTYLTVTPEMHRRDYMGQARQIGWRIAKVIDGIVRQEIQQAEAEVATGQWRFLEVSCSGETCETCERPLWHHVQSVDAERLCPNSRRFWHVARALMQHHLDLYPKAISRLAAVIAKRP